MQYFLLSFPCFLVHILLHFVAQIVTCSIPYRLWPHVVGLNEQNKYNIISMKLVPRERPWPRVSYDCRQIPLLAPKQTLPLVIEKMASMQHKAFSVLEFSKTSSVIVVQRAFRQRYGIDPPLAKNIRRWYVCNRHGGMRHENVRHVSVETTNKMKPCNRIYYSTVH